MKPVYSLFLLIGLILLAGCETKITTDESPAPESREDRTFLQLKEYSFVSEAQVRIVDNYLKSAYIPALKRAGIQDIGVFKTRESETDTVDKLYVLIPFISLNQYHNLEEKLEPDQEYLDAGKDYLEARHDEPPYSRIESTLMVAFEDFPGLRPSKVSGAREDRIYELRSYESPTESYFKNKVDMFNAGGEITLFDRLDFNAVFYGEVISGSKMPNLMYMTTFTNQESRDTKWKAFFASPEWEKLMGMSKYENNVSQVDIYFLYPTEYSDY